jgi:cyclic pyranopterin phosphate synthase
MNAREETPAAGPGLTHIAQDGSARMVDVSGKPEQLRLATATGSIALAGETIRLIERNEIAKGNVLATARIAGIQAAKRTSELIPLCHTLLLQHVDVALDVSHESVQIRCEVRTIGRTGAEMEALTGVTVAALTIYDMCKAVDKAMRIGDIALVSKTKLDL